MWGLRWVQEWGLAGEPRVWARAKEPLVRARAQAREPQVRARARVRVQGLVLVQELGLPQQVPLAPHQGQSISFFLPLPSSYPLHLKRHY